MSVTFVEGFDLYNGVGANTGLQSRWTSIGSTGPSAMVAGRFGGQAYRGTDGSGSNAAIRAPLPASQSSFAMGFAFKQLNLANIGTQACFKLLDSAAGDQIAIYITGTGVISARVGSTAVISSATGLLGEDSWSYIELFGTIANTGGTLELWVNGNQIGTFTGDTQNSANANVAYLVCSSPDGSGSSNWSYYDDLYCTDTATRLGERRIETLYPTGDVAQGWARSTGSANYALVDEAQVNGDTDYVQGSSVGDVDTYDLGNLATTPTAIDAVQVSAFGLKTDAASRSIALQVKSGATTSDGSNYALAASYAKFERLLTTNPDGGGAWSASAVNALQSGPKVTV